MKAYWQTLIGLAVLGFTLSVHTVPTWAGLQRSDNVFINSANGTAQGSLTGARYDAGPGGVSVGGGQFIACSSDGVQSTSAVIVQCSARDNKGTMFYCYSTDSRFEDAMKGMTDAAHIHVTKNNGGQCTELTITNESSYLP